MVTLPFVCSATMEVRAALSERRIADAKRIATKHLRAGYASPEFLNVVAEMLAIKPKRGKRGPKHKKPPYWLDIGSEIEELRYNGNNGKGMTVEEAIEKLKTKYGHRNTIQKAWAFYRNSKKEHDNIR
jgi:hypothetical protein